jgi:hypothetical protein
MHMCTHTYTQTHPPACACKHARKHNQECTHVGHAMGWRANARANASRRTAQRAPRQDAMCSIRQKKSQAECTSGGEVYRTRTFESRPTSGPPLPFQPLCGAFVVVTSNLQASHQSLARWQGNAQIPAAAFARLHATHLFFPCANAAYEQACILACCWRGFHLHKFVADPQASLRGLAAALEPRKPMPAGRYRAEPRENVIASGSGSSPMYVANRSGASNQSRSSAMQAAWEIGRSEMVSYLAVWSNGTRVFCGSELAVNLN